MDELIFTLLRKIFSAIKCKINILLYTRRAIKNKSFVDHAIALAYEYEYSCQFHRDKHGNGEVIIDTDECGKVSVYSDEKGTFSVAIDGMQVNKHFFNVLQDLCKQFNQNTDGIVYSIVDSGGVEDYITISSTIEADSTEKDARYYISGYMDTLKDKRILLIRAFNKYKKEHPECMYGVNNYNIV